MNWKQAEKDLYFRNFTFDWDKDPNTSMLLNAEIPDLSFYAGEYEDLAYGKAVIRKKNGKAILELLPAKELFTGHLYYISKDTLNIKFKDPFIPAGQVVFKRGADNKVVRFKLDIASSDFHFKYLDFRKLMTGSGHRRSHESR